MTLEHQNRVDWPYLIRLIKANKCTPIINNKLPFTESWNHDEMVKAWAKKIEYPLKDKQNLPRIAQFFSVTKDDEFQAKISYLEFVREYIFQSAIEQNKHDLDPDIKKLATESPDRAIPQIAKLDYTNFQTNPDHPLSILANLPFEIFLTTSYHTLIEDALRAAGKEPYCDYYRWSEDLPETFSIETAKAVTYEPTVEKPLVYHLHGIDSEPQSLVLTEDNFFEFFESIRRDVVDQRGIPIAVRDTLSSSAFVLLGFELQEWDFRVLFRGLVNAVTTKRRPRSLSIQLSPQPDTGIEDKEAVRNYLRKYFNGYRFGVYWGNIFDFTQELKNHWEQ